jgi:hypothetical protein
MLSDTQLTVIVAQVPATIIAISALIASLKNGKKADRLAVKVDGRLTELLALTRKSSHAEGMKDEKSHPS